jgi:glycosyltransferase involved in cell wall biosynthesis
VAWFAAEVVPRLSRQLPDVVLSIVGAGWPDAYASAHASSTLVFRGHVPDIADVFDTCRLAIAPLPTGAGIKGKVADALARGVPQVLSSIAAEGMPLGDGREVLMADTVDEWIDAIATLVKDDTRWSRMSTAARALAAEEYSFDRGVGRMSQALGGAGLRATRVGDPFVVRWARPDWGHLDARQADAADLPPTSSDMAAWSASAAREQAH